MDLAEPLRAPHHRADQDAQPAVGRWYDPDSASFIDDRELGGGSTYSPLNRGGRFSMKAAIPSA
jgi:hypothetical protein